jgi:hypothetical protein
MLNLLVTVLRYHSVGGCSPVALATSCGHDQAVFVDASVGDQRLVRVVARSGYARLAECHTALNLQDHH